MLMALIKSANSCKSVQGLFFDDDYREKPLPPAEPTSDREEASSSPGKDQRARLCLTGFLMTSPPEIQESSSRPEVQSVQDVSPPVLRHPESPSPSVQAVKRSKCTSRATRSMRPVGISKTKRAPLRAPSVACSVRAKPSLAILPTDLPKHPAPDTMRLSKAQLLSIFAAASTNITKTIPFDNSNLLEAVLDPHDMVANEVIASKDVSDLTPADVLTL
ncbi:unnamed protein product [Agarophyton chilense]